MNERYDYIKKGKLIMEEKIMLEKIAEETDLFGFCIAESTNEENYDTIGRYVLSLFENHPENREAYEQMLIAICGYGLDSLVGLMDEKRDYYDSL